MRILLATAVATSIALTTAGCTTNPQTGEQQINRGAIGALIGAAAGAAIDKNNHGRGAAIGAVLGGGTGLYMEKQRQKMQAQMAGTGVDVNYNQATGALNLVMPGNVTFATNKANITPNFMPTLDKVAATLVEFKDTTITVSGHTDNVGNAAYNQDLSRARAGSVANYLSSKGVAGNRISPVGYGMSQPVADNGSDAGRSQNRRVEITINPTAQAGS